MKPDWQQDPRARRSALALETPFLEPRTDHDEIDLEAHVHALVPESALLESAAGAWSGADVEGRYAEAWASAREVATAVDAHEHEAVEADLEVDTLVEEEAWRGADEGVLTEAEDELPNLIWITHAGPYRIASDRIEGLGYGVIQPEPGRSRRRFRGTPELKAALDSWAAVLPRVLPDPAYILTGGLYTNKAKEHGRGRAIDVDGFWWSENQKFMAKEAPTDWPRYLSIEATLRRQFGTVLNHDYNRAHQDHWHCDLGMSTRWRAARSQALFVERALKEIWGEAIAVDGRWSRADAEAAARHGHDLRDARAWDGFLEAVMARGRRDGPPPARSPAVTPAAPSAKAASADGLSVEQVRFAQRVLNAVQGERLVVDGVLGPRTRAALDRFRARQALGPGTSFEPRLELALAQKALEEARQQSLFGRIGVLDDATRRELTAFREERGLGTGAALDAPTRDALAGAAEAAARAIRR